MGPAHHVKFKFRPERVTGDDEVSQGGLLVPLLIVLAGICMYNYNKVWLFKKQPSLTWFYSSPNVMIVIESSRNLLCEHFANYRRTRMHCSRNSFIEKNCPENPCNPENMGLPSSECCSLEKFYLCQSRCNFR